MLQDTELVLEVSDDHCSKQNLLNRKRDDSESSVETSEMYLSNESVNSENIQPRSHPPNREYATINDDIRNGDAEQRRDVEFQSQPCRRCNESHKKTNTFVKFVLVIIFFLLTILALAVCYGFYMLHAIEAKVDMKVTNRISPRTGKQTSLRLLPPFTERFTGILLKGNDMVEIGRRDYPIRNWKLGFMNGTIGFKEGKKIHIKKAGLYYLYAQMFFFDNAKRYPKANTMTDPVMDFGIRNVHTNERIIATTVQLNSCKRACTRHLSRVVRLEKDVHLTVDTATPGVVFRMIKDKSYFGTYMISGDMTTGEHAVT